MPEATAVDLARIRAAVQFRDGCVKAALERYESGDSPIMFARAAFDAMELRIRHDERKRAAERVRTLSTDITEPVELAIVERATRAVLCEASDKIDREGEGSGG